ncbi:hypothetical protein [Pararhodobacter aggregans]|uniref:hypothetical protein n=1 Tax=Pararhodobacter aggregans TaxID=404875 RepID=UPI0010580123|nr:hypothetical protein [Pararhodobacter aggregans]
MIENKDNGLRLTEYPEGYSVKRLNTADADRLNRLRTGLSRLELARATMELLKNGDESRAMLEAVACAASIYYFSCFGGGSYGPRLRAEKVFKNNKEAKQNHDHWKTIRDQRFGHLVGVGQSIVTLLIADDSDRPIDTKTISMDIDPSAVLPWMKSLYQLIGVALIHIQQEVVEVESRIREAFEKLSPEEFLALPDATIPIPHHERR